jgi:hypothetical protein
MRSRGSVSASGRRARRAADREDVFADAGGQFIAVKHTFTTTASSSGQVVVQFVTGAADNPIVNGIVVN